MKLHTNETYFHRQVHPNASWCHCSTKQNFVFLTKYEGDEITYYIGCRYKDDVEITKSSLYSKITTRDDGTSILEIFSLLASRDSGVYRCEAHSNIGSATTEAKLIVKRM